MDPRIARRAAASALMVGILADVLFDRVALGINVPIATAAVLALVTWFGPGREAVDRLDLWLPVLAILASLGPALRTDPSVVGLDLWLVAAAVSAWSFAVSGVAVTRRTAAAVVELGVQAGIAVALGLAWLLARSGADGYFSRGTRRLDRLAPLARGALIAIPVVAGFSLLLASADAVFGRAIDAALGFPLDLDEAVQRGTFSVLAAVLVAGPLAIAAGAAAGTAGAHRWSVPASGSPTPATVTPADGPSTGASAPGPDALPAPARGRRSGATETLVVLVAVDLLFALFAAVQVVYLFGGADTLEAVGMTYSDYARQGYFQLVGVVGLAGLLLLGAHEVVGRTRPFLLAGLALLGMTGVILASAAVRLSLYQGAYGWTELRFFVAASIAWLGICVVLAAALLVRDRMRWLPHGLAMSAVAVTLAVSALGPQAFVMSQNLARVRDPGLVAVDGHSGFDAGYGLTLGEDAIPDLVAALDSLLPVERALVLRQLRLRQADMADDPASANPLSWNLSWNLARERAREALANLPPS